MIDDVPVNKRQRSIMCIIHPSCVVNYRHDCVTAQGNNECHETTVLLFRKDVHLRTFVGKIDVIELDSLYRKIRVKQVYPSQLRLDISKVGL